MKKLLILGAGSSQLPFIEYCLINNHSVQVLDGSREALLGLLPHPNLKSAHIDIRNEPEVLKFAGEILPDAVIAPSNDAGLLSATKVAEEFQMPGPGIFASTHSRNKFKFRKLLQCEALYSPWFLQVRLEEDVFEIAKKIPNFPCVIKPVQGSGSKGVRYLSNQTNLSSYFQDTAGKLNVGQFQIEEFVEGVEYSLEGIVQNGLLVALAIFEKVRSPLPNLVDIQVNYPPSLDEKLINDAVNLGVRVVEALQVINAPIHLEFIHSPTHGLVPVECAVRAAGFNLFNTMVPWCTGVDVMKAQLDLILGEDLGDLNPTRDYAGILNFPQPSISGIIKKIHYFNPMKIHRFPNSFVEIKINKLIGEWVTPSSDGTERLGHIFVLSPTWKEAQRILAEINFLIDVE